MSSVKGDDPVYPKRVRFHCTRCAVCCGDTWKRIRHVLLLREEAEAISVTVNEPAEVFATKIIGRGWFVYELKKAEGRCVFLRGKTCLVYGVRPLVCRVYPFSLSTARSGKHKFQVTLDCPGVGSGPMLSRIFFWRLLGEARRRLRASSAARSLAHVEPGGPG